MPIESNATQDEIDSPYYQQNKKSCLALESYVLEKNGKINGKYNAFTYLAKAVFKSTVTWRLTYQKSNYLSRGNLLLSSKKLSLLYLSEWKAETKHQWKPYKIRRAKAIDRILKIFSKKMTQYHFNKSYVVIGSKKLDPIQEKVMAYLSDLFRFIEVYEVEFYNNILRIELRSEQLHLDILDQIVELIDTSFTDRNEVIL